MRRPPRDSSPERPGFTLVELLVVILILAILIALLVPAIASAVRAANDARAAAEITNMATALADFKSKYGDYPPSRIVLHNNGYYNPSDTTSLGAGDITLGTLNSRTARYMKKFFPRAGQYFNTSGTGTPFYWDLVGQNPTSTTASSVNYSVILQGHECLVFFLGGIPSYNPSNGTYSLTGFSKDPTNPFTPATLGAANRTTPLYEFAPGRLMDIFNYYTGTNTSPGTTPTSPTAGVPNYFPSYADPLSPSIAPRAYAYFSAYGNNQYDPGDDNSAYYGNFNGASFDSGSQEGDNGSTPAFFYEHFDVSYPLASGANPAASYPPNPYTNGNSQPFTGTGSPAGSPHQATWMVPQTFQLLSAGRDGLWGYGGGFDPNSTSTHLPAYNGEEASIRSRENDNISNFQGGKLN